MALPWHQQVAQNLELWDEEVFNTFPSIIAHEYYRVKVMFQEGQTYGALLQIKDLLEVILKFPTLAAVSDIYYKQSRTTEENKILLQLIEKPLSLGNWQSIARTIFVKSTVASELKNILKDVHHLFESNKIVNWRNSQIGHGALSFDTSEEFQLDLIEKLQAIKGHFQKMKDTYSSVHFYTKGIDRELRLH